MARSTFPSQNDSTCTKHTRSGPLLAVEMSKKCNKCTPLWREANFEVNMLKTPGVRTTFGAKREGFVAFSTTTTNTPHYTPIHYATLKLQLQLHLHYILLHYTPLHYIALNYTQLHYTTLHYITLHYTTFHYTSLHYTTLHSTTLQLQLHNYTPLHSTPLNYTPLD